MENQLHKTMVPAMGPKSAARTPARTPARTQSASRYWAREQATTSWEAGRRLSDHAIKTVHIEGLSPSR